jgi:hypothetical protein
MLDQSPPRVFETSYIGVRYLAGKRAPNIESFNTPSQANAWAAEHEPVKFFGWQESVPEDFDGFAVEEQRFIRGEYGNKSRVWSMPSDVVDSKPVAATKGKPVEGVATVMHLHAL